MYAVVETGGKQYRVAKDDVIKVEKLAGIAGDKVQLDRVLMVGDEKSQKIGTPLIAGTVVTAEILEQKRDKKIIVFKKKRRQGYQRTQGHRQSITVLRITDIGGAKAAAPKKAAEKVEAATVKTAAVKKAAVKKAAAPKAEAAPKVVAKKAPAKKAAAPKAKKETK